MTVTEKASAALIELPPAQLLADLVEVDFGEAALVALLLLGVGSVVAEEVEELESAVARFAVPVLLPWDHSLASTTGWRARARTLEYAYLGVSARQARKRSRSGYGR